MTRKKPISEPPASVRAQRPRLAPDAIPSIHRIDELDAQNSWLAHIAVGPLACPEPVEGNGR